MTNAEMHAIQVQNTPVLLERALTPAIKLLGERLVESTDCAGTWCDSQQRLGHFPDLVCACSSDKHLCESFCNMGFIPTVPLKSLGVEVTRAVSGHLDIFDAP
jgi:hypothetical protein